MDGQRDHVSRGLTITSTWFKGQLYLICLFIIKSFFYSLLDIQRPNRMAPSKVQSKTGVERKGGTLSNPSVVRTSLLKVITAKKP